MNPPLRILPRAAARALRRPRCLTTARPFSATGPSSQASSGAPPTPPEAGGAALRRGEGAPTAPAPPRRLPEFTLAGRVVLVSGAAQGLGLVQAEALLEAGAIGGSCPTRPPGW